MKQRKIESIKARVEASDKIALMRLASTTQQDVSDLIRQAIADLISKYSNERSERLHGARA